MLTGNDTEGDGNIQTFNPAATGDTDKLVGGLKQDGINPFAFVAEHEDAAFPEAVLIERGPLVDRGGD